MMKRLLKEVRRQAGLYSVGLVTVATSRDTHFRHKKRGQKGCTRRRSGSAMLLIGGGRSSFIACGREATHWKEAAWQDLAHSIARILQRDRFQGNESPA